MSTADVNSDGYGDVVAGRGPGTSPTIQSVGLRRWQRPPLDAAFDPREHAEGNVLDALEIAMTSQWRSKEVMYYDFEKRGQAMSGGGLALGTRSPIQSLDLSVKVFVRRSGEHFVPELQDATFTARTRPKAPEDDGTREWMLKSDDTWDA